MPQFTGKSTDIYICYAIKNYENYLHKRMITLGPGVAAKALPDQTIFV
jgi:hypothetical protein